MIEPGRCHDINAWEPRRLGDVAEIGTGSHNTQDGHLAGPYPFFIRSDQKLFLDDFDYDEEAILIPGDGRIGQIYHYMNGKYALHQRVYRIKVDSSVDTRFILYLMESRFRKHALAMNSQGTVPSLRKPIFTEWGINLPRDRDEQVRIGMLFSQLDNLIAAEKRKLDLLKDKKTALLRQIFDQKERFKGYTDPWEQRKLGSLGTSYSGLSGKDKTDFGHGFGSYITYLNVFQNPIADIDGTDRIEIDPKQNTVHYGDVFFTVSSETPEEVGMSSVWLGNQQNIYLNSFCFGYRQKGTFDIKYLAYMLRSRSIRNRMKILAQGISRFNISQRRVMDIEVSFPSMDEQQKIGVLCGKLDQLIAAESRKIDLLELKKKALLQQMFV